MSFNYCKKKKGWYSSMKTITIKVKNWCRGEYRNKHGHCCAMGFAGKQLHNDPFYFETESFYNLEQKIIDANDGLYSKQRRKTLKDLFKKAGYKLLFK